MIREEACAILEIPAESSDDDAKKAFRKLSKKYHPDVNKEPGADEKFKKINEAYQVITTGVDSGPTEVYQPSNISLHTTISFQESVLGTRKEMKYNRHTKCKPCNGQGQIAQHNGCEKCNGRGQIVSQNGFMVTVQTCDKCFGRRTVNSCRACRTRGVVEAESTITVTIPGGVQNGNTLRLAGMGDYAGSFGPMDQHTDVFLNLIVDQEEGLKVVGADVVSSLDLSLVEALKGCKKTVKTILGSKEIDIAPKSRNKEEVIIPHVGVNRVGNQRVILDVKYPEDIEKLINVLTEEGTA